MKSGFPSSFRNPLWLWSLGFLLACLVFAALRLNVESRRQRDLAAWAYEGQLSGKFWSVADDEYEAVIQKLASGKTLPSKISMGPNGYQVDLPAAYIDPKYEGWQLILTFYRHKNSLTETLRELAVIAPANLPSEPTGLWWAIERFREAMLWLAAIAWIAGLVLIVCVRGVRRRIAPICLAAGLLCMLCAALDVNFDKTRIVAPFKHDARPIVTGRFTQYRSRSIISNFPGWFDAGGAMALLASLVGIFPARSISPRGCAHCGYDLTGNESGICPECGQETAKSIRHKRLAQFAPAADRLSNVDVPVSIPTSDCDVM